MTPTMSPSDVVMDAAIAVCTFGSRERAVTNVSRALGIDSVWACSRHCSRTVPASTSYVATVSSSSTSSTSVMMFSPVASRTKTRTLSLGTRRRAYSMIISISFWADRLTSLAKALYVSTMWSDSGDSFCSVVASNATLRWSMGDESTSNVSRSWGVLGLFAGGSSSEVVLVVRAPAWRATAVSLRVGMAGESFTLEVGES
mmetsp:Transcript_9032/g.28012  ORF Transcript_9032/g.28012 Transcript_9032/m.28012 type:complete len:201 (-) Transcript_9032:168-770(-)